MASDNSKNTKSAEASDARGNQARKQSPETEPVEADKNTEDSHTGLYDEIVPHLTEMRSRLIRSLVILAAAALLLLPWANDLYTLIAQPWLMSLPEGSQLIATEVASPILVPIKTALILALLLTAPYLVYQVWSFIAPGLYKNERDLARPLTLASIALFYTGVAFAFFLVFPVVFRFIDLVNPEGVAIMTDIHNYLSFVLGASVAFGFAFQVPVVVIILIVTGMVSENRLAHLRPYIIVGAFVIGMLLTPPDIVSQIMLAGPMWLLFELGLVVARSLKRSARMGGSSKSGNTDPAQD